MNTKWKINLIGMILAIIFFFIFTTLIGRMFAIILTMIYVGYAVGGIYRNGAFNGVILGVILAIISSIGTYYISGALVGEFLDTLPNVLFILAIIYSICGAIGGIIGIFIKGRAVAAKSKDENIGYLLCDKCGGYYELQLGESQEDYEQCQCGGKLEYIQSQ